MFTDASVDKNAFIGVLIRNLMDESLFEGAISEYRRRSCVAGKEIYYVECGILHEAEAVAIDDNGGLVISENGFEKTLVAGEVTLRIK